MQKWKVKALDMVNGFHRHLSASAPRSAHVSFDIVRQEIRRARRQSEMKNIEERLETLLQSRPYFRGAGLRFLQEGFKKVISNCEEIRRGFQALEKRYPDVVRRTAPQLSTRKSRGPHLIGVGKAG
jgi:glutathione S-transferase